MERLRLSTRLFRLVLRLFPRAFRRQYGDEMVANFSGRQTAIRAQRGRLATLAFTLRSFVEAPHAALTARRTSRGPVRPGADAGGAGGWLDDLRLAVKSLTRAPAWTLSALLILVLGIGGTAAVFSVLNAVLLRPLPYADEGRLMSLWTVNELQGLPDGSSWVNARDWLARSRTLEDVTLFFRPEFTNATVTSFGEPERIHVGLVAANFFELLGVDALQGRVFGAADLDADADVAVIGEGLWQTRYGGDPGVVGRMITINGEEVRILGVVPREVGIPLETTRIWRLYDMRPTDEDDVRGTRDFDGYRVVGRLAPGIDVATAQSELDSIAAALAAEYPDTNRNLGVRVTPLRAEIVGDRVPLLLWTVLGSMVLVLLVGGTNVAQLMLSRGIERRREMAIRASLGASRLRINRQLLLESLLMSLAAGAGGLLLARLGLRALLSLVPADVPLTGGARVDGTVMLLSFGVSAILAPLVGLLPALAASRTRAVEILRAGGRGSTAGDRRLRSGLVVAEVAMAVVLLAGAALLVRSAMAIREVDPGFDASDTLMARVDLSASGNRAELAAVEEALLDRVRALPGVEGAGAIEDFFIVRFPDQRITLVGDQPREPGDPVPQLTGNYVSSGFFAGLGVPVLLGRDLEPADVGAEDQVVVVNRAWADAFADGRNPVGLQFRWGDRVEGPALTVVGVVANLRRTMLEEPPYPQMFRPGGTSGFDLMVAAAGDPTALAAGVRRVVHSVDPQAAVSRVSTAWEGYDSRLAPRHFQTVMFAAFAAFAILLASVGLFAILHDAVLARRREFGIRLALGAAPVDVRALVMRQGLGLAGLGLVLGLAGTVALSSLMARLVYGIRSTDPGTLATVGLVLMAVSALASALPARAATRVAPAETLSSE